MKKIYRIPCVLLTVGIAALTSCTEELGGEGPCIEEMDSAIAEYGDVSRTLESYDTGNQVNTVIWQWFAERVQITYSWRDGSDVCNSFVGPINTRI